MQHYPIAYAINDGYTLPLMASLIALFESTQAETVYDIYILNYQLSSENRNKLREHIKQYSLHSEVVFLEVDEEDWEAIPYIGGWGREASYRLLLPKLLPNMNKILYLDVDTVVMADLSHLFHLNLNGKALAGVLCDHMHRFKPLFTLADAFNESKLHIARNHQAINNGVLLINLDYWRKERWGDKLIEILHVMSAKSSSEVDWWPDQDAVSYLLSTAKFSILHYLPLSYNWVLRSEFSENDFKIVADSFVSDENMKILKSDQLQIMHMVYAAPWIRKKRGKVDLYYHTFKPYADSVGLRLYRKNLLRDQITIPMIIKMMLPYGVLLLKRKLKNHLN